MQDSYQRDAEMAVVSPKRALSSGIDPVPKKPKVGPHVETAQYVYITMSTRNIVHEYANDAVETITTYHSAYQTQEDADNALKIMANERYPSTEWCLDRDRSGQLTLSSTEDEGYHPEDAVNLKVQRIITMPPDCTSRVKVLRLADPGGPGQQVHIEEGSETEEDEHEEEAEEGSSDEGDERESESEPEVANEEDDELEIVDVRAFKD